jgi:hypothetical protein
VSDRPPTNPLSVTRCGDQNNWTMSVGLRVRQGRPNYRRQRPAGRGRGGPHVARPKPAGDGRKGRLQSVTRAQGRPLPALLTTRTTGTGVVGGAPVGGHPPTARTPRTGPVPFYSIYCIHALLPLFTTSIKSLCAPVRGVRDTLNTGLGAWGACVRHLIWRVLPAILTAIQRLLPASLAVP